MNFGGTRRLPSKIAGAPDQRSKKNRAKPYFFWISDRVPLRFSTEVSEKKKSAYGLCNFARTVCRFFLFPERIDNFFIAFSLRHLPQGKNQGASVSHLFNSNRPPRESHFCPPKIACNFRGTEWIRGGVPSESFFSLCPAGAEEKNTCKVEPGSEPPKIACNFRGL